MMLTQRSIGRLQAEDMFAAGKSIGDVSRTFRVSHATARIWFRDWLIAQLKQVNADLVKRLQRYEPKFKPVVFPDGKRKYDKPAPVPAEPEPEPVTMYDAEPILKRA